MSITYKIVQERLRKAGIVMSKRGCMHRINFFGGLETTAYYADSLEHALEKGMEMAETAPAPAEWMRAVATAGIPSRHCSR